MILTLMLATKASCSGDEITDVYLLPKGLDVKVAKLAAPSSGCVLVQANFIRKERVCSMGSVSTQGTQSTLLHIP